MALWRLGLSGGQLVSRSMAGIESGQVSQPLLSNGQRLSFWHQRELAWNKVAKGETRFEGGGIEGHRGLQEAPRE
jgi:hypothetical protein